MSGLRPAFSVTSVKCSVAVVAIEMVVRQRVRLYFQRIGMHRVVERAAVDHVEIEQAGVVVVEPHASRARCLRAANRACAEPKLCVKSMPAFRCASSKRIAGPARRRWDGARLRTWRGVRACIGMRRLRRSDRSEPIIRRKRSIISVASRVPLPAPLPPVRSTAVVVRNSTAGTRFSGARSGPTWQPTQMRCSPLRTQNQPCSWRSAAALSHRAE